MADILTNFFRNFNRRLDEPVRQHLKNVYACLTISTISAAVGAYVHVYTNIMSNGLLSALAGIGFMIALLVTPHNGKNTLLRLGYLLGLTFFMGMSTGPLIQYAIKINPSLILSALMSTSLIFGCFTLSVLFARRGYWLFLLGPLSTLCSMLFFLSLGNIFFGSFLIYQINIYLGLLAMCGFIIFDTTVIIEKFKMGDKDFISHAVALFVDFIGLFKRLLIILTEKEVNDRERKRNQ